MNIDYDRSFGLDFRKRTSQRYLVHRRVFETMLKVSLGERRGHDLLLPKNAALG